MSAQEKKKKKTNASNGLERFYQLVKPINYFCVLNYELSRAAFLHNNFSDFCKHLTTYF